MYFTPIQVDSLLFVSVRFTMLPATPSTDLISVNVTTNVNSVLV
jgi:hypothetical protein